MLTAMSSACLLLNKVGKSRDHQRQVDLTKLQALLESPSRVSVAAVIPMATPIKQLTSSDAAPSPSLLMSNGGTVRRYSREFSGQAGFGQMSSAASSLSSC